MTDMTQMPKYRMQFEISGAVETQAKDADHAQEIFDRMTVRQLAEHGELQQLGEPQLEEETVTAFGRMPT
jgi:hypothetical protein